MTLCSVAYLSYHKLWVVSPNNCSPEYVVQSHPRLGTTQRTQPNGTEATSVTVTPIEPDPAAVDAAYAALNTRITTIHKGLPPGTVLCIMSGNGDPRLMSSLNVKKSRWDGMMRERKRPEDIPQSEWWTMEEGRLLEDATERAKRGLAFFCLIR